jgi:hypothetical protein
MDGGLASCAVFADTIQCPRNDARRRRFADAANAREHEGVRDAARGEGIRKGANQRFLADQTCEVLRAIFSSKNAIGFAARRRRGAEAQGWFLRLVHSLEPGWMTSHALD